MDLENINEMSLKVRKEFLIFLMAVDGAPFELHRGVLVVDFGLRDAYHHKVSVIAP